MRKVLLLLLLTAWQATAQSAYNTTDSSLLIVHVSKDCDGINLQFLIENQSNFIHKSNSEKPFHHVLKTKRPVPFSCYINFPRTRGILIKGLALPSDTLEINIDIDKQKAILAHFKGKSDAICNYYNALESDTCYMRMRNYHSPKDLMGTLVSIDSTNRYKKQYLAAYNSRTPLAEWFVEYETLKITYGDALEKLKAFSLYNVNYGKKVFLTPQFLVWIADVPISNPAALQTQAYYEFLQTYFSLLNKGLYGSGVSSKILSHFKQTIPDARKQLNPEVLECYLAYNIQEYYNNGAMKEPLDALILSLKPEFKNETLYNSLVNRSYNF
ncbi:MAG TPA: hypothetical protein VHO72_17315 [Bacteroidales bacterium]|nr:hypothetical protein [Bacteroidales bacterium]